MRRNKPPTKYRTPTGWAVAQYETWGNGKYASLLRRRYFKHEIDAMACLARWSLPIPKPEEAE
jgi:hypothetical protein